MKFDKNLLNTITTDIRKSKLQANIEVNKVMLQLYWRIGQIISDLESDSYTLEEITSELAKELKSNYSETITFSEDNLVYMQRFYKTYPDVEIVPIVLGMLSWEYHIVLMDEVETQEERIYYTKLTIEHSWGVDRLFEAIRADRN